MCDPARETRKLTFNKDTALFGWRAPFDLYDPKLPVSVKLIGRTGEITIVAGCTLSALIEELQFRGMSQAVSDDRREGRGRLSSLDLMPEEAEADIVWALEQLRERTMPQIAILDEFNARLADRGIAKVSKSAFSRWSVRKAIQFRRLDEVRAITSDVVAGLGTGGADEVTVACAEMLKVAIYESLEGQLNSKAIMELPPRRAGSAGVMQHHTGCRCGVCKIGLLVEQVDRDVLARVWAEHRSSSDGEVEKLRSGDNGAAGSPRWCALQAIAIMRLEGGA